MTSAPGRLTLRQLLDLLLRAIERINEDIDALSKAAFLAETKAGRQLRDAVVLNLGTMGEIAEDIRKQHPDFAACHAQIPFKRIWDMRCHLFHGYHSVDYEVVWTTCRAAVPELERQIRAAVAGLDDT